MMCDECGAREATIHYTEVVDGRLSAWHLCEDCARKRGATIALAPLAGPLVNILMGLLEDAREKPDETGPVCTQCGLSYEEFRRLGKLGCGGCYDSFHDELEALLRRVHGTTSHVGRAPSGRGDETSAESEIRRLKADLAAAVRKEEYERAAELRDLIRAKEGPKRSGREPDVDVRDASE